MKRIPILLAFMFFGAASAAPAQVARRSFLFKDARGEVAQARARGQSDVLLVIASMPGENEHVARTITAWGGTIQFRADDVDYLRARVPVDSLERLVLDPNVHSLDISITRLSRTFGLADEEENHPPPLTGTVSAFAQDTGQVWPPVLSDFPLANRYNPLADIGADEFRKANPTYDGRGVTLALIDGNPDMLLPELQVATTLDGKSTPKIVVYETVVDADEEDDGRWIRMKETVTAANGRFVYDSTTYTAPRSGTFRVGIFNEAIKDSLARTSMDKDYNRDGNPEGSSREFAVLWDENSDDVWVDTDQDLSFTDEKALTDYSVRPEFGVLGTDDPETPVRESVGFAVQIDRSKKNVGLNFGVASHASLVIGAAVASRGENGRFDGVAPGAQLASVSEGGSAYGQTEAAIVAARNEHVDIIFFEQSSLITRNYLLRDGRLVPTVIYERLIDVYKKPIVVPTHNYPILGAIDDFVLARGALGIGGHESKDNFFTNHGVRVEHDDNLLITGGYGPMGNGALKPDIISPSNYVSTWRGFQEGRAIPGLFQLPPGYTIAGGTSTATPTATAAVALLISAAKQENVKYDAYRLKHAITTSARYVPHLPAYKQGNGVINVVYAWEILKALDAQDEEITITSSAPVRTQYSHLLPEPDEGVGLYERSGWNAGDRGERTVTFTRRSGPRAPMTFAVSWVGNDSATFSAPASVTLPLNEPVAVDIGVEPKTHGVHTALLTLEHPSAPGYAYRMLTTIVAAEPLTAADSFTIRKETEVPRPGMRSFFYNVPEGVTALKVDVTAPERAVSLAIIRPDTRAERVRSSRGGGPGPTSFVANNPMAGTWEIRLTDVADTRTFDWEQAKKKEPVPPTEATLTVTAIAAEVTVAGEGGGGGGGGGATHNLSIANSMASFTGGVTSNPMGTARRERPVIREKEQQMFEVEVLPGSTALVARTFNLSDPRADLDVYVFDCTNEDGECRGAKTDADRLEDEWVIVQNPSAGTWKVIVDAASVPSGSTTFDYLDVVFNPSYGMVSVTDLPEERKVGAQWNAMAHSWVSDAEHASGREPYPAVLVQGQRSEGDSFLVSVHELIVNTTAATGSIQQ